MERGQPPGTEIKPWPRQQSEAMIKSSPSAHSTPLAAAASWWAHQLPPGTRVFETQTAPAPCCFSSPQSSLALTIQEEAASCKMPLHCRKLLMLPSQSTLRCLRRVRMNMAIISLNTCSCSWSSAQGRSQLLCLKRNLEPNP